MDAEVLSPDYQALLCSGFVELYIVGFYSVAALFCVVSFSSLLASVLSRTKLLPTSRSALRLAALEVLTLRPQERRSRRRRVLKALGPASGVRHVAVIMDGNRRYGERELGDGLRGHEAGGKALGRFIEACMAEGLEMLTVYAFSTENWSRSGRELDMLMDVLATYSEEMRRKAKAKGIRVRICSTQPERLPASVRAGLQRLEKDTDTGEKFQVNICVSYGGRDEIASAAKRIAQQVVTREILPEEVDEELIGRFLTTAGLPDPELLLRTSGEKRLSNFLLFQCAYSELVFIDKLWPEIDRGDLREVLKEYMRRHRRFGK